ncbi:MAG TPA: nucleoside-diphosphate sugar epimerase/dehydratase [Azospira sp.]|nr:nucleoside-diphosphate sugar epimerase/dehydratase [Azospira sp.]
MNLRALLVILHDLVASALAWAVAYWLRFNFDLPPNFSHGLLTALPWVVVLQGSVFSLFGLYRGMWRFASLPDLKNILVAVGSSALVVPVVLFLLNRLSDVPRSVLFLDPLLLVLMMGGSRFAYRAWRDGLLFSGMSDQKPVIVLGAGEAAATLLRDLHRSSVWNVVALLDDDPQKKGRRLAGVPVAGTTAAVAEVAERYQVRDVIVAMPAAQPGERRHAVEAAAAAGLTVHTVPALEELLSGRVTLSQIRRVELEDLLGRAPVELDSGGLTRLLSGRTVLVTGAGGSIGSELCRQVAVFHPQRLVFFDASEFALYRVEQEFVARFPDLESVFLVGDVRDGARLAEVFATYRPDVVFHAAAYKHVPLMERENAWQAVRNNVLGSLQVARASLAHGVSEMVMVSTDKAVNPTNVMGATKRLAERICQHLQASAGEGGAGQTRFVTVRFGNVLGSNGSVIPKFREQIAKGGPVTVTHPEIIRYFMLIPEAAQLVLQAGLMGEGGEIFVLEMGEPIKIVDLARDMIRLSGFSEEEIPIQFTGLRPGEKLYEELLADDESTLPTPHSKLRVAKARDEADAAWLAEVEAWLAAPPADIEAVKAGLLRFVPEYRPQ